jgi:hypothetical protein
VLLVQQLSNDDTNRLVNEKLHFADWAQERRNRFQDAFQDELPNDPNRFVALPPQKRSYYLINNNGRPEALFGINYRGGSDAVKISSFARLIEKDDSTIEGWQYLKEVIEHVLLPHQPIKAVFARIDSPGGKKAFEDLRRKCGTGYTVEIHGSAANIFLRRRDFS